MSIQTSLLGKRKSLEEEMNLPSDSSKKSSTPDLIASNQIQSPIADTEEETHEEDGPLNDVDSCSNTVRTKSVVWFRRFCNNMQPLFKVVSGNTIKKDIFKIYDVEKEKTMRLLNKNWSRIAITSDLWIASNQNKGYMTITAHFIDNTVSYKVDS
ncbi:hypothetical protein Patl1_31927 [Pistacia atlantica]|uniref:Uncharacterized protein n=1 Tax=Pistacia atlantica TaxID=434234 RepID=A0ACC1ALX7_9ROSI|nr:hypothetical protein Patl1_31927 [Pistacia atlantica]